MPLRSELRNNVCAYLVLLHVEIARFTLGPGCPGPRLVSVALILTSHLLLAPQTLGGQPLAATLPFAVRTFLQCGVSTRRLRTGLAACTSGSLVVLTFGIIHS